MDPAIHKSKTLHRDFAKESPNAQQRCVDQGGLTAVVPPVKKLHSLCQKDVKLRTKFETTKMQLLI
jgi:hypothetical protein